MQIAVVENRRFADQLAGLAADDWTKPTDCPLWDVRAVVAHVIGSAAAQASPREFIRQVRTGRPLQVEIGSPSRYASAPSGPPTISSANGRPSPHEPFGPAANCPASLPDFRC